MRALVAILLVGACVIEVGQAKATTCSGPARVRLTASTTTASDSFGGSARGSFSSTRPNVYGGYTYDDGSYTKPNAFGGYDYYPPSGPAPHSTGDVLDGYNFKGGYSKPIRGSSIFDR